MATEFAHSVRAAELELAVPLLPEKGRVLELGAGDGWQANELARRGFAVTAVDVPRAAATTQYFPVTSYDGRSLPFPSRSFDAIYSSNVLEHVAEFEGVQHELARVLRPGGIAVHCVPSATWRVWTSAGHPLYAARWAWRLCKALRTRDPAGSSAAGNRLERASRLGLGKLVWQGLVPQRHGEHGGVLSEHWLFSRRQWSRRFRETHWDIREVRSTHLFYTGNELFGLRLGNPLRTRLAAVLGTSTWIFVLRPPLPTD